MKPKVASVALVALCMGILSFACSRSTGTLEPAYPCPGGIEATFIQLSQQDLTNGVPDWTRELGRLQSIGIRGAILQYCGDELGPFDGRVHGYAPVKDLLEAASTLGIGVLVGLYHDPRWPNTFPIDSELPPPLGRPTEMAALLSTCQASPACVGWYVPQEIDDLTWAAAERRALLRGFLDRTSQALRGLGPGRPIAIAPFYTGTISPGAHAQFWSELLADHPIDLLMLQDGVGSGHGDADKAAQMLGALLPATSQLGVELWSTLELFQQIHGPPRDALPFEAVPADFSTVKRSLQVEGATGVRLAAFSMIDYMNPERSEAATQLFDEYVAWCAEQRAAAQH